MKDKKKAPSREEAWERKRADYWHEIATFLMAIIGGVLGGAVGIIVIKLFCN